MLLRGGAMKEKVAAPPSFIERLEERLVPVMERLSPALAVASSVYTLCLPYAVKAFHYGFIPMVILLGMQSTPKPKLVDLLTPM